MKSNSFEKNWTTHVFFSPGYAFTYELGEDFIVVIF